MADETSSMWSDMLGIGPLLRMASDPETLRGAMMMMQAATESLQASRRIEAKLDELLLRLRLQHEPTATPEPTPPLLEHLRTNGAGGHPATSGVADDGSGAASPHNGNSGEIVSAG
jgi:hypothetical protein